MANLLHNLARGPQKGKEWHPLNIAKALFWSSPGLVLLAYMLAH